MEGVQGEWRVAARSGGGPGVDGWRKTNHKEEGGCNRDQRSEGLRGDWNPELGPKTDSSQNHRRRRRLGVRRRKKRGGSKQEKAGRLIRWQEKEGRQIRTRSA